MVREKMTDEHVTPDVTVTFADLELMPLLS